MRSLLFLLVLLGMIPGGASAQMIRDGRYLIYSGSNQLAFFDLDHPEKGAARYEIGIQAHDATFDGTRFYLTDLDGPIYTYLPGGALEVLVPARDRPNSISKYSASTVLYRDGFLFAGYHDGLHIFRALDGVLVQKYPDLKLLHRNGPVFIVSDSTGSRAIKALDGGQLSEFLPPQIYHGIPVEGMDAYIFDGRLLRTKDDSLIGFLSSHYLGAAADTKRIVTNILEAYLVYDRETLQVIDRINKNTLNATHRGFPVLVGDRIGIVSWDSLSESPRFSYLTLPDTRNPSIRKVAEAWPLGVWDDVDIAISRNRVYALSKDTIHEFNLSNWTLERSIALPQELLRTYMHYTQIRYDDASHYLYASHDDDIIQIDLDEGTDRVVWNEAESFEVLPDGTLLLCDGQYQPNGKVLWLDPETITVLDELTEIPYPQTVASGGWNVFLRHGQVVYADPQTRKLSINPSPHPDWIRAAVDSSSTSSLWYYNLKLYSVDGSNPPLLITENKYDDDYNHLIPEQNGGWTFNLGNEAVYHAPPGSSEFHTTPYDVYPWFQGRTVNTGDGWMSFGSRIEGTSDLIHYDAFGGNLRQEGYSTHKTALGFYYPLNDWYYFADLDSWLFALPAGTSGFDGSFTYIPVLGWTYMPYQDENNLYSFERNSWLHWWGGNSKPWWFYQFRNNRHFAAVPGFAPVSLHLSILETSPKGETYTFRNDSLIVSDSSVQRPGQSTFSRPTPDTVQLDLTVTMESGRLETQHGPISWKVYFTGKMILAFSDYEKGTYTIDGELRDTRKLSLTSKFTESGEFILSGLPLNK